MKSRINPRIVITPKIIGYCIDEQKKDVIMTAALELNVDISYIGSDCAGEKIGYIACINGILKTGIAIENPPDDELLVISGLKDTDVDRLLEIMREQNTNVDLKCILTPTNQNWQFYKLIEELKKEHNTMHKK